MIISSNIRIFFNSFLIYLFIYFFFKLCVEKKNQNMLRIHLFTHVIHTPILNGADHQSIGYAVLFWFSKTE